jgi:hypothetical protein
MVHKYAGMRVIEILRGKKASIRAAPLPAGSPSWSQFEPMYWEEIESGAKQNLPGFRTIRKLLTDQRFDK